MTENTTQLLHQLEAAAGERELDLRIENVRLLNVYTGEIYPARIDVYDGRIVGVNAPAGRAAKEVVDGGGRFALPGFIDTHVHIETTLLTPEALGEVIVPWGTTALFVDAMEIANVAGMDGLQALVAGAESLPYRLFLEIPSRVPTAPGLETTGGVLDAAQVRQLLQLEEALSLGELDPSKVLGRKPEYLEKITAALEAGKICNGHAIGLGADELNIYAAAHLSDDHESVEYEELLERLRLGIVPLIREGSSERNAKALLRGVVEHNLPTDQLCFCTDDKHVNDIMREGHISYNVQCAIDLGMEPVKAIQIATINAARHFRVEHLIGSLCPGRCADILLLDDLQTMRPAAVYKGGRLVARQGKAQPVPAKAYPQKLFQTVTLANTLSQESFRIPADGKKQVRCRVIRLIENQIINREELVWMPVSGGEITADTERDILKLAVVERYGKNGRTGMGLVTGFGLRGGALASSVSHDHHNIVAVGANDADMLLAVREVARMQGGFAAVRDGKVQGTLPLPLAGLMSPLPCGEVMEEMNRLNQTVHSMGCGMAAPFMTLSFISLPTVPQLGLTDYGLIDVADHCAVDLIVE